MSAPAYDTVNWFQIGTDHSEAAQSFYGGLFGWKFTLDSADGGYDLIRYPGADAPSGGIAHTKGGDENHATFLVIVRDVAAACAEAERLGGEVLMPATIAPSGLVFAYLTDPSGNQFGVYTPPAPPA
ncbi:MULTISPECIES: VOC family protein [Thermomonosporaceae]|uniref:VOC family protein n=1 Tax=Thermomonosporaceae TaxID=2012 RepID=UPI00255A9D3C|nr:MULTISPECIES: VOC family protein [Thermomonosporaceae]MDL4775064.1 VOC family protein [Actinomadura xylanilytica]